MHILENMIANGMLVVVETIFDSILKRIGSGREHIFFKKSRLDGRNQVDRLRVHGWIFMGIF